MKTYTRNEAASVLGVHPQTVSNYAIKGLIREIREIKGNRTWLSYPAEDIERLLPHLDEIKDLEDSITQYKNNLERDCEDVRGLCEQYKTFSSQMRQIGALLPQIVLAMLKAEERDLDGRDGRMFRAMIEGASIDELASAEGLTRERTRQILQKIINTLSRVASKRYADDFIVVKEENAMLKKKNELLKKEIEVMIAGLDKGQSRGKAVENILSKKISDFQWTVRAYNCLKRCGIETVADLVTRTRMELMKTRNFGRKSLGEIDLFIEKTGLSYGMNSEDVALLNLELQATHEKDRM